MEARLDHLPLELAEKIILELNVESLKALRRTNKRMLDACLSQFNSNVSTQRLDFTSHSIERLTAFASLPRLRSALLELRLLGIIYDTEPLKSLLKNKIRWVRAHRGEGWNDLRTEYMSTTEIEVAQKELDWMTERHAATQALTARDYLTILVRTIEMFPNLSAIEIDCEVYRGQGEFGVPLDLKNWPAAFYTVSRIFNAFVAASMTTAAVPRTLNICYETLRCSAPVVEMDQELGVLVPDWRTRQIPGLKSLSISLSTRIEVEQSELDNYAYVRSQSARAAQYQVTAASFIGFVDLLKLMTDLEELHIHFYNTYRGKHLGYIRLFESMAANIQLPSLKRCSLRGFQATENAMLSWLDRHRTLEYLELAGIELIDAPFTSVFDCISSLPRLQRLNLSSLTDVGSLPVLHLELVTDGLQDEQDRNLIHTREFKRHEFCDGFNWAPPPEKEILGSSWVHDWRRRMTQLFGPP